MILRSLTLPAAIATLSLVVLTGCGVSADASENIERTLTDRGFVQVSRAEGGNSIYAYYNVSVECNDSRLPESTVLKADTSRGTINYDPRGVREPTIVNATPTKLIEAGVLADC